MKKSVLRKYATLIATVGVNVQKGQEVFIAAELDQPEFVKMVVEECYRAGAKRVVVDWDYQPLTKLHVRWRSQKNLSTLENWEEARWQHYVDEIPCRIYLISEDPDGLRGVNQEKMAKAGQAKYKVIRPYRDQIENKYQWCIAAVPGVAWAKKLFPNLSKAQAVEKLWEAILAASRVDDDPVAAWTEEVFISPKRGVSEGIVYSTKPLSYQGQLIENFSIRFEGGKAVEVHAEKNEALLQKLISMDEGASYLGECALVPYNSPIQNSGLLFYNTLFDENAACHLALGMGFADTIKNFENYTLDECRAKGINDSMVHEDFMIGSADLSIDAHTRDGRTVPIFRDGNWAF